MISQTVEYALRAIVTIAQHAETPCTSQKIAKITGVPAPYLSKLMQGLARADLVTSKRGLHGGFLLTKDAAELTIWDVVNAVEPFQRIRQCPLGIGSHSGTLCPLHRRMDNALALVEESFRQTTVAELLPQEEGVSPLCAENQPLAIHLSQTGKKKPKQKTAPRKKSS